MLTYWYSLYSGVCSSGGRMTSKFCCDVCESLLLIRDNLHATIHLCIEPVEIYPGKIGFSFGGQLLCEIEVFWAKVVDIFECSSFSILFIKNALLALFSISIHIVTLTSMTSKLMNFEIGTLTIQSDSIRRWI